MVGVGEHVKSLAKTAYRDSEPIRYGFNIYGRSWDHWPTLGFVFGFGSANTIDKLAEVFAELARNEPDPALRVDGVFVLNRGSVIWQDAFTGAFKPTGQIGDLAAAANASPGQVLMTTLSAMNSTLTQVTHGVFDITQYMSPNLGEVSNLFSTVVVAGDQPTVVER